MANYPELRDLQMLLALAQHKHFTHAAVDCGISQPAFSAHIRHLEEQLGIPIVRRGNKFLGFTKDGELVLKWARKIVTDAEGLRQDIELAKGNLEGTLVLGVVPTALSYAAVVTTRLREAFPELSMQILSLSSAQIAIGLHDYSLDAGFTYQDETDRSDILFDTIYDEYYVLLVPGSLAPRKTGGITWAEAAELPLCLFSKDMHFRQIVDAAFEQSGVIPRPVMETNAFTAAIAKVDNGSAATITPASRTEGLRLGADTISLPLTNPIVTHAIGLAVLDHEPGLPAIAALREAVATDHN